MTYVTNTTTVTTGPGLLSRLGTRILDALAFVADIGPTTAALERLSQVSNAELEARGTSRDAELRRILGARWY